MLLLASHSRSSLRNPSAPREHVRRISKCNRALISDVLVCRGNLEHDCGVMSEELDDVTDSDLMEGLLFDLGIFGGRSPALGEPRSRRAVSVERTLSAGSTTSAACGVPASVSTVLSPSFDDDPLSELTEKCAHSIPGQ